MVLRFCIIWSLILWKAPNNHQAHCGYNAEQDLQSIHLTASALQFIALDCTLNTYFVQF